MHGASIVALTMYDMLKPIDKQGKFRPLNYCKKGGKSDYGKQRSTGFIGSGNGLFG
jgi:molybdenum cofactor biosynthesis enzyme